MSVTSDSQLCRTCLATKDLAPIFTSVEKREKYTKALYLSTGLQIQLGDNLPQLICNKCIEYMKISLQFRERSRKAERTLLAMQTEQSLSESEQKKTKKEETPSDDSKNVDSCADFDNDFDDYVESFELKESLKEEITDEGSLEKKYKQFKTSLEEDITEEASNIEQKYKDFKTSLEEEIADEASVEQKYKEDRFSYDGPAKQPKREKNGSSDWYQRFKHLMEGPLDSTGLYRCKPCNKILKNLSCFKSHAKRHFGFEFLCEQCGKTFVNKGMLSRHCMTQHGAERTLRCQHCDYGAIDSVQLKVHIRREHTGDRPFICDTCGSSFRSRPHLIHHLAVHQTDRPVQCPHCTATFKSRQHLATHTSKVHRGHGWRAACYICGKTYSKQMLVRRHISRHHAVPVHQQRAIQKVYEAGSGDAPSFTPGRRNLVLYV